ncbi:MAG: hypothetical protein ACR2ML_04405 [Solirubrobacteraceae bacterium]
MSSDSELIPLDSRFAKVLDLPLEPPREVLIERMADLAQLTSPSHPVTTKRPETRELLMRIALAAQRLPDICSPRRRWTSVPSPGPTSGQ